MTFFDFEFDVATVKNQKCFFSDSQCLCFGVICLLLFALKFKNTMEKNKREREEQQRKKKEQEENTYRRRTTTKHKKIKSMS